MDNASNRFILAFNLRFAALVDHISRSFTTYVELARCRTMFSNDSRPSTNVASMFRFRRRYSVSSVITAVWSICALQSGVSAPCSLEYLRLAVWSICALQSLYLLIAMSIIALVLWLTFGSWNNSNTSQVRTWRDVYFKLLYWTTCIVSHYDSVQPC